MAYLDVFGFWYMLKYTRIPIYNISVILNNYFACSIHGLIRGENMELGRDSDTGGQVTFGCKSFFLL